MSQAELVEKTAEYVKEKFTADGNGHDWWHMHRVWQLSKTIAAKENGANLLVVELGALLHDIADWKFNDGDTEIGPKTAQKWLEDQGADSKVVEQVTYIVKNISYRGGTNKHVMQTLEGKIVQDADRLDALGAVGIGRTFAFGGARGREMYNPDKPVQSYENFEEFKNNVNDNTSINHFYEKLLKLKDGMHTESAKQIAQSRHDYMERFLDEFHAEWEGKR